MSTEKLGLWQKIRRGVWITLGSVGVIIGAIFATQPPTIPPPIPVVQVAERSWIATNDFTDSVTVSGVTYTVTIRKGFKTDYASIPVKLQPELGLSNDSPCLRRGAYLHDGLFSLMDCNGQGGPVSMETANLILYTAILKDGCVQAKADAILAMVNAWGPFAVLRHTPESVRVARGFVQAQHSP